MFANSMSIETKQKICLSACFFVQTLHFDGFVFNMDSLRKTSAVKHKTARIYRSGRLKNL